MMQDLSSSQLPITVEAANGSDDDQPPLSESAMDVDDGDDIVETPEEDDEAELGLFSVSKLKGSTNNLSERLMKEWSSPIYVFFKQTPRIEYVEDHRAHVFVCAAGRCKGKYELGFSHIESDRSVYVYSNGEVWNIVPIYIDDITHASKSPVRIQTGLLGADRAAGH
jgi:hypothetical protein